MKYMGLDYPDNVGQFEIYIWDAQLACLCAFLTHIYTSPEVLIKVWR